MAKNRPYQYYDQTISLCSTCLRQIEAKHVIEDNKVYMYKWCPAHGTEKVLISSDAKYWRMGREVYIKPPEMPARFNTEMTYGCPYDCGLCPDHMQHSCLSLLEITDNCNLSCPVCFAGSDNTQKHKPLETVLKMADTIVKNEITPDVVQISGGEPTLHPDILTIIKECKKRPIRHLMVNTNGIRIANDEEFVRELSEFKTGFEVYLQFDSLDDNKNKTIRGANLLAIREKALANLNKYGISTTLVMTVLGGINDDEIGTIIDYASKIDCVRGVTVQPVSKVGRCISDKAISIDHGLVRQKILEQSTIFKSEDIIPVPCNPDALSMGYALKMDDEIIPLTGLIEPEILLSTNRSTIVFEHDEKLKKEVFKLFSTNLGPSAQASSINDLLCCLPQIVAPNLSYKNVFRVLIMSFMDEKNFDVRAMKKSCVHIATEDDKLIPFESFNIFYRTKEQRALLSNLRKENIIKFKK